MLNPRKREKRATQIQTRRGKQGTEWCLLDRLEKSWDGTEVHPGESKRLRGAEKSRPAVDPVRGPVARKILDLRLTERLRRSDDCRPAQ